MNPFFPAPQQNKLISCVYEICGIDLFFQGNSLENADSTKQYLHLLGYRFLWVCVIYWIALSSSTIGTRLLSVYWFRCCFLHAWSTLILLFCLPANLQYARKLSLIFVWVILTRFSNIWCENLFSTVLLFVFLMEQYFYGSFFGWTLEMGILNFYYSIFTQFTWN